VSEENAPDAWVGQRVMVHVAEDTFNGLLVSVDAGGVVLRSALNEPEIVDAIRRGQEPDEPYERLCWFPWRHVQAIVQLEPEE
jgi:hypothetical protein